MPEKFNSRAVAAKLAWQIIDKGQSLDAAIGNFFTDRDTSPQDRGLVQELVYGLCRWYGELDAVAATLLKKPIRTKDREIHFVLLVGLYQLRHLEVAQHAAVAETVAACQQLKKPWAKNLINGCLRGYLRDPAGESAAISLPDSAAVSADTEREFCDNRQRNHLSHPEWMIQALASAWPEHLESILEANNQRPPMCLRVNRRQGNGENSRDEYLTTLNTAGISALPDRFSSDGIILDKPAAVGILPGFSTGAVSVQDTAAQLAFDIMDIHKHQTVLDACAAPGGKAAHILERTDNSVSLDALDISERRCEQLHNTLNRLQLTAQVYVADASKPPPEWTVPKGGYDRILIDAPCSGLGVIRRHPDIKHHRRVTDIPNLMMVQKDLLNHLWGLLKPGGLMLYMTCSVLPSENQEQIRLFMSSRPNARAAGFEHPNALELEFGKQTLPGVHGMDGFYYCLISKIDG